MPDADASLPTTVTAKEFQRQPGRYQRLARARPVTITAHGEPHLVVLNVDEYTRLQEHDRLVAALNALSAADTEDLLATIKELRTTRNAVAHGVLVGAEEVKARILAMRDKLRELGVAHVSLFGSMARGAEHDGSDVDIVVDTEDGRALGLFALARVSEELQAILGRPVDVISQRGLENTESLKKRVTAELVRVY